jgi:thymidylate kinase
MNCKSVVIEGSDQVGKGDTVHDLANELLANDIPICRFSFPQYATPFGAAIRTFLKNGVDDIGELADVKGTRREIEIRMMMFALDRLQALESVLRLPDEQIGVLLLDRGPYSNALTIAYGLYVVDEISDRDISEMTKLGFDLESYLINRLNLDNCVIQLSANFGKKGWQSIRGGQEDQYEKKEIQEKSNIAYIKFSELVGEGWKVVITKEDNQWKERSNRNKEVMDFIEEKYQLSSQGFSGPAKFESIDVIDISKDIYNMDISEFSDVVDFYKALDQNDKKVIYDKGRSIAGYISENCTTVTIKDDGVKESMYNILERYPECLLLLEEYYGIDFTNKVREAIYE